MRSGRKASPMTTGAQIPQEESTIRQPARSVLVPRNTLTTRRGLQLAAVALTFSYAVFNSIYLRRSEKTVTWETVYLGLGLILIFWAYQYFRSKSSVVSLATQRTSEFSQNPKLTVLSLASVGIIFLFATTNPAPHVYAAALDLRLKSLTTSPDALDRENVGKIISAVRAASESGLRLRPQLVDAASSTVVEASQRDSSVWPSALRIMAYRSTQNRAETSDLTRSSCFTPSVNGKMRVSIEDSSITGCPQALDTFTWKNVVFENAIVTYHGGPTKLESVQFKNCRFVIDYSPRGQELAKALVTSQIVTIDLSDH
jgi:hypothetical protein